MIVSNNQFIIKANSEKLRKEADRALIQAFIDNKQKKDFKDFVKFVLNDLFNFNRTEGKRKEQNKDLSETDKEILLDDYLDFLKSDNHRLLHEYLSSDEQTSLIKTWILTNYGNLIAKNLCLIESLYNSENPKYDLLKDRIKKTFFKQIDKERKGLGYKNDLGNENKKGLLDDYITFLTRKNCSRLKMYEENAKVSREMLVSYILTICFRFIDGKLVCKGIEKRDENVLTKFFERDRRPGCRTIFSMWVNENYSKICGMKDNDAGVDVDACKNRITKDNKKRITKDLTDDNQPTDRDVDAYKNRITKDNKNRITDDIIDTFKGDIYDFSKKELYNKFCNFRFETDFYIYLKNEIILRYLVGIFFPRESLENIAKKDRDRIKLLRETEAEKDKILYDYYAERGDSVFIGPKARVERRKDGRIPELNEKIRYDVPDEDGNCREYPSDASWDFVATIQSKETKNNRLKIVKDFIEFLIKKEKKSMAIFIGIEFFKDAELDGKEYKDLIVEGNLSERTKTYYRKEEDNDGQSYKLVRQWFKKFAEEREYSQERLKEILDI